MYRNLHYNNKFGEMTEWTWNEDGERVERRESFKPFLYVETALLDGCDAKSIFGTNLRKIEFANDWDRRKFVERTTKRLFFNIPAKQQYLLEKYQYTSMDDMVKNPLKTFYLDIEVYSHDTFPEAEHADYPINVITIYDTAKDKFFTWGLGKDFDPSNLKADIDIDPRKIQYVPCRDEEGLLDSFLEYWTSDYPDLLTGWNSSTFDIPYIINRITKVLGESSAKRLSPIGHLYNRVRSNIFGKFYTHWVIDGVSDIDYLELYAKSEMNQHESYKLGYIGNLEGVDGKVEYESANLATLADDDWNTFITYNIQDVNIMVKLEAKKRYLRVARGKAYRGFSTLDKALDSVPIVTGMIAKAGLDQNEIIVTYMSDDHVDKFDGGFVFKPSGKVHRGIVSFDVNSLYPNTMITLNTSPETKVGKIFDLAEDKFRVELVSGKSKVVSGDQLEKLIKDNNLVRTKANILFSQKRRGICAKFLDDMYNDRKSLKKQMAETDDPDLKEKLDIEQYLLKILLNSVYGVFGNKYFGLYDLDIATSVTLTGQAMIKESTEIMKRLAEEKAGVTDEIVVYGDTDSNFFDFGKILTNMGVELFTMENGTPKVSQEAKDVIDDFENQLNVNINEWATRELNSNDTRYNFSREKICLIGTFLTKKNYILRVLDNEGEECDKIVEKGCELVKSSHSDAVKEIIRDVIYCIFYEKGKAEANEKYKAAIDKFKALPYEDIAIRKNVRDHEKWAKQADGIKCYKGTPQHHKGAIYYNYLIDVLGLAGKYPKITTGQKIKNLYLEKNKYGMSSIAFIDVLPPEFELKPDYDIQFQKMITPLVQRCYDGCDWRLPSIDKVAQVDLFDFLGIDE